VAFYVEGHGYYVYLRMPFGLTGAPATFCEMVAIALEDMISRELVNWMDDICLPGDDFDVKLNNLRKFFTHCRDHGLSLSPSKTKLFFTNVLFAGAMVGPDGIKPNLDKVAAVANWPIPQDVQDLMGFLGLTNYFRHLICDYACIVQPLSDLTRDIHVDLPKYGAKAKKGAYKCALKATSLKDKWGPDQQKAFITLKVLLSQEPILKPPQYDGHPFRVMSDGSSTGLTGFLSQPFNYVDSSGKEQTCWHPVSYCSKRTSKSEERYEPFLLEFTALKFCLDEFDPYIYSSPIEIETDCQALRDCLLKEKISIHHSRWKESILAHNIIDIRHRLGIENVVADGLSRMWQNCKQSQGDGSNWSVLVDLESCQAIRNDVLLITMGSPPPIDTSPLPYKLEDHFKGDIFFEPIILHLLGRNAGSTIPERHKAMHQAQGFEIKNGKLWCFSSKASDQVSRTECIPKTEAFHLALSIHHSFGHFKNIDSLKLHIHEQYFWPSMDNDCRQVVLECPECKNFGPSFHNALLQHIRHSRPFALVCGDYLSLPTGHGGYKQIGLYVDVYSGFVWATKLKAAGTAKSTISSLKRIFYDYAIPTVFMSDSSTHFKIRKSTHFALKMVSNTLPWQCMPHGVMDSLSP
jgi:RNase H-like domain found in reverse transcriptase/Integrase zinc binding domain/Reverse transcriptase (RNA-dependent DNA polymerase)